MSRTIGPKPATNAIFIPPILPSSNRGREPGGDGNDLAAVAVELVFLVAVHEIDVELVDPGRGQLAQLFDMLVDFAQHAETIRHLVAHKGSIAGPNLGVVVVVVSGPIRDVAG